MNSKTLTLTIAAATGTAITLTMALGEVFNYKYNDTLDPRAPFLRSRLTSLKCNEKDLLNEEVDKFYRNNGEGFLIATPIEGKSNEFTFKYYARSQKLQAIQAAQKNGSLKNWNAVSKFLEINKRITNEFTEYVRTHRNNPSIQKILQGKDIKLEYLDFYCSAAYAIQALNENKITRTELYSLLIDMPQPCIDTTSGVILAYDNEFIKYTPAIITDPKFEEIDKEFRANIGSYLNDPFLKKISPNLHNYIRKLNIKQFGFRILISREFKIVTNEEILAFMNKVVPNFQERFSTIINK